MSDLGAFIELHARKRRQAGQHDCCTYPSDWAIANDWADPMAEWRGAYSTEDEALSLIEASGGLVALFERGMASAGIPATAVPDIGDIGILSVAGGEAGAICCGRRWSFVTERGVGLASVDPSAVIAVWRVRHG